MRRLSLLLFLCLTAACGITPVSSGPGGTPSPAASPNVVQDLTLVGKVADRWTNVDGVECSSSGDSLQVSVKTTRNNVKLVLTMAVSSGYEGLGDYQSGVGPSGKSATLNVKLTQGDSSTAPPVAISTSSLPLDIQVTQKAPAAGTVNASLGQVADQFDVVEMIRGGWRCPST